MMLIILVGCKTTVKTVKENAVTNTQTKVEKSTEQAVETKIVDKSTVAEEKKLKKTIEEIEKAIEEFEARLIIYDTDKPVDEKTGKPPTKSELFITNKKAFGSTANKTETGSNTIVSNSDVKMAQEATTKINTDNLTTINEKKKVATTDKTIANKSWILFVVIGVFLISFLIFSKFSFVGVLLKAKKIFSAFFK